jgi:hypothetical protein
MLASSQDHQLMLAEIAHDGKVNALRISARRGQAIALRQGPAERSATVQFDGSSAFR